MFQTKQVSIQVCFTLKNNYCIFLHFDELGPCVYIKLKKCVTGLWISWNLVYIFLTYMDILYVEMVSWQRPQPVKMLIPNLTEYKIYSRKLGYHAIKMNAHLIS